MTDFRSYDFPNEPPGVPRPKDPIKVKLNGKDDLKGSASLPTYRYLHELKLSREVFWLVDETLPRVGMVMVYGRGGCGKTYLGASLAIGLAAGQWHGRDAEKVAVLYGAFERPDDAEDRLAALRDRLGLGDLPICHLNLAGYRLDEAMAEHIIAQAKKLAAETKLTVVVLIDTVSAALGGAKEDDAGLGVLRSCGERIASEIKGTVFWLHHEGKCDHNGPRGHLVLAEACAVWWRVEEREDGSRVVHVDKANRGPSYTALFAFRLVPFVAGQDQRGKDIQLCDLQLVDLDNALASQPKARFGVAMADKPKAGHGALQKMMLDALKKLAWKHPDGVEEHLLRSEFILRLSTLRQTQEKPKLTPNELARKFRRTLSPMIATDDSPGAIEKVADGLLLLAEEE